MSYRLEVRFTGTSVSVVRDGVTVLSSSAALTRIAPGKVGCKTTRSYAGYCYWDDLTVVKTGADQIVSYDDFYPYGQQMEGRSYNAGLSDARYKYIGEERDVETGYDYFGARYYDARIGRWLSVDPLAEATAGWSPYNYGLNNPIGYVDIAGLYPVLVNGEVIYMLPEIVVMGTRLPMFGGGDMGSSVGQAARAFVDFVDEKLDLGLPPWLKGVIAVVISPNPTKLGPAPAVSQAVSASEVLAEAIANGTKGSKRVIEMTGGKEAAKALFEKLRQGGTEVTPAKYAEKGGTLVRLPNGDFVGYRTVMEKSPGTEVTIDIRLKDFPDIQKIKFNP